MAFISVNSSRFGKIEIDESELLSMQAGILGFPDSNRFLVMDHEEDSPFKWLQSIEEPDVAFVITDPLIFFPEYHDQIKKEELSNLELKEGDDLITFVILSLREKPENMTANLQGPIIVNSRNRHGRQIVLKGARFTTKHHLFPQLQQEK